MTPVVHVISPGAARPKLPSVAEIRAEFEQNHRRLHKSASAIIAGLRRERECAMYLDFLAGYKKMHGIWPHYDTATDNALVYQLVSIIEPTQLPVESYIAIKLAEFDALTRPRRRRAGRRNR